MYFLFCELIIQEPKPSPSYTSLNLWDETTPTHIYTPTITGYGLTDLNIPYLPAGCFIFPDMPFQANNSYPLQKLLEKSIYSIIKATNMTHKPFASKWLAASTYPNPGVSKSHSIPLSPFITTICLKPNFKSAAASAFPPRLRPLPPLQCRTPSLNHCLVSILLMLLCLYL